MPDKQKKKPKSGGGRTTALAALLAIVAAVALWLSDCIPGFGIGSGTKEGEAETSEKAEEAKPDAPVEKQPEVEAQSVRKPMPMKLTIDARGCSVDGGEPIDCATLCEDAKRFEGVETVLIDAKNGPHGVVVEVLDCLKAKSLSVSITRE